MGIPDDNSDLATMGRDQLHAELDRLGVEFQVEYEKSANRVKRAEEFETIVQAGQDFSAFSEKTRARMGAIGVRLAELAEQRRKAQDG